MTAKLPSELWEHFVLYSQPENSFLLGFLLIFFYNLCHNHKWERDALKALSEVIENISSAGFSDAENWRY